MDKKPMVHPALTEFALAQAKDWEAVAQERLGVIERLCAEVEALRGELSACTSPVQREMVKVVAYVGTDTDGGRGLVFDKEGFGSDVTTIEPLMTVPQHCRIMWAVLWGKQ